jgi:hypothetical protein
MIWPAYAMSVGHIDEWVDGVQWQTGRLGRALTAEMKTMFFNIDPLLLALAVIGLIYARIKREYFLVLWVIPYLIMLFLVDWVYFFHFVLIYPAFCIAIAMLFMDLAKKEFKARILRPLIFFIIGATIVVGLTNSLMLITTNLNSSYFELVSLVSRHLPDRISKDNIDNNFNHYSNNTVTLVGPNGGWSFFWLVKYVLDRDVDYEWFERGVDYIKGPIKSEKFLLMVDRETRYAVFFTNSSNEQHVSQVKTLFSNSSPLDYFFGDTLRYDLNKYPYTNIIDDVDIRREVIRMRGVDWTTPIEIRANYWDH